MLVTRPPPCMIGAKLQDVFTPALVLDMPRLEQNLRHMAEVMQKYPGVDVRPHAKAHKSPELARLQVDAGAVGMCCQTLTEAEAMCHGGVKDIFVSNQVIGLAKLRRFAALSRLGCRLSVCVDDVSNIRDVSTAAVEAGTDIDLVIEVNVGQDRCGVEPGPEVADLARVVLDTPHVNFKGIQCYQGGNQHVRNHGDRGKAVDQVVNLTTTSLDALKNAGVACSYVTGGGTGTFEFEAASGVFTEVQPGSYCVMDVDYGKNLDAEDSFVSEWETSLYILTTVQSVSKAGDRCVVDAGMKAASLDSGPPAVMERSNVTYYRGGDEHGILKPGAGFKVGDQVRLTPGHCDPTVNLYDELVCVRDGHVEAVWPVSARGPGV